MGNTAKIRPQPHSAIVNSADFISEGEQKKLIKNYVANRWWKMSFVRVMVLFAKQTRWAHDIHFFFNCFQTQTKWASLLKFAVYEARQLRNPQEKINLFAVVNKMVRYLPRSLDKDYAFNVNSKKIITHKSFYLDNFVKKVRERLATFLKSRGYICNTILLLIGRPSRITQVPFSYEQQLGFIWRAIGPNMI